MISIRKTADELERLEQLTKTVVKVYDHAIWSSAQYAVELDSAAVNELRQHLHGLRDRVSQAASLEDWNLIQASFRGEIREFRDKTNQQLARLRSEIAGAASAMQAFADSVATSGAHHEENLQRALGELSRIAEVENLDEARSISAGATATISESIERMQKLHKLAIAQLRDEIRLLHDQVEMERRAAFVDQATGVWNRQKMEAIISGHTERNEPFSLLIVRVRNLRRLERHHSRSVIENSLRALSQRLTAMLEENTAVGRWENDSFGVLLQVEPAAALRISRETAMRLSGTYAIQEEGVAQNIALVVVTGAIDHAPGTGPVAFAKKLAQMSNALSIA